MSLLARWRTVSSPLAAIAARVVIYGCTSASSLAHRREPTSTARPGSEHPALPR